MPLVKTIAVFAVTGISMILFIPIALALFVISCAGIKKPMALILYRLAQFWARTLIFLTGCPMTVTGREWIPKKGGVCFVSNHVGIFDIILALAYAGRPFGFIAKKELLLVPGVNIWIYLLGGLFIDRKKPRNALKTINLGVRRIKAGAGMLIFPEGTRSKGLGLGPFHPGSLKLASQSEALIVPVAITGSYDVFEKTRRVRAVPVSIAFLPPVNPGELPPADRKIILAEKLHAAIARALPEPSP
ncbi:MAG: 1-acyl-sn-glycerol-3-phosphate acyltransferase [Treponema sp.]|jgi:1-acyl-sn-glycerol-3-phosphate acyltransferase|nr:1-acyl-sn-glycerol-3-phosphate acyltransferase [Treponema sp.]